MGTLYRDLKTLAAIRDRLSSVREEEKAQDVYKQFARQHEEVDDQLDRMLRAASRAARLSREAALR
ncbi:hypothetical protein [Pedomonas mirosovicensis]|uniref:hypothetical protein n=1 Tax=Pedomonas mirosovicensis TaxID=2908641 RepID=UPI002168439B|nr:hypothetical protein [Pedomonas mirosovicensis]MCH8686297.1 hypothetical protein [Pedomonas mirosovicensis]